MAIKEQYDVIIVGTGAAGLYCSLQLNDQCKILIITKDAVENSDSYLAQGGICTLKGAEDFDSFYEDTMKAGHYENREESVEIMINSSPDIINDLLDYGVDFDRTPEGLSYTREGAHATNRILHHADITGKEITSKLYDRAKERSNITIAAYTTMLDIIEKDNTCIGVVVETAKKEIKEIYSKVVVWATGGIGGLFENSTNFRHITGDSIAISLKRNIELENIQYIQIHPTALYATNKERRFLISEAVRGEGAILLNPNKERFVDELLPRDIVSEAIYEQMNKYASDYVYLSFAKIPKEKILDHFPNIYKRCLEEGYDLTKDLLPVTPVQHYHMGGVKVDKDSKTSMNNLFAIGEVSCNGVHGANRLASNSLLESLVFAKRAANSIGESIDNIVNMDILDLDISLEEYYNAEIRQQRNKKLILDEIKRRDKEFYAKWCIHAS